MNFNCPVTSSHGLVEIAEGLFQCPECGAGPSDFWALYGVEVEDEAAGALCVAWRPDLNCYVLTSVLWEVDATNRRISRGLLDSTLVGYASTSAELERSPLPARGDGRIALKPKMFSSPLGEKIVQKAARRGTSSAARAPNGSSGSSPRRRRKAV